ncbi:hypothetical protein EZY14_001170 [Kordia sp. TARA_039_SRF]|nr:hypothetical protein EZY14_001170 [Kordia sp. TARA_039_SRF]
MIKEVMTHYRSQYKGSIMPLVDYLKINRRVEESQNINSKKFVYVVDQNFDYNNPIDNKDIEVLASELSDISIYNPLQYEFPFGSADHLAIKVNDTADERDSITYYLKRVYLPDSNNPIVAYKSLTNPNWVSLDDSDFILIPLNRSRYKYYYNSEINRVLFDDIANPVFAFSDTFTFNPKDVGLTNGRYILKYVNHKGKATRVTERDFNPKKFKFRRPPSNYTDRNIEVEITNTKGKVYLFPTIQRLNDGVILEYKYTLEKFSRFDIKNQPSAIKIKIKYLGTFLHFINKTIFYDNSIESIDKKKYLDLYEFTNDIIAKLIPNANSALNKEGIRQLFIDQYITYITRELDFYKSKLEKVLEIFYYTPEVFIKHLPLNMLWNILGKSLKGKVTNFGLDKEDIVLKLLIAIEGKIKNPKLFIDELLLRRINDNTTYFYALYDKMNTSNFDKYVRFIWSVWKNTIYKDITKENPKITSEGETILNYKSDMTIGFHHDNATIQYLEESNKIQIDLSTKVVKQVKRRLGKKDVYIPFHTTQEQTLFYDPFAPVVIFEEDNPHFIFKDDESNKNAKFATLPAFVILANDQKAFWHNVIVGAEYAIDVVTTVSGVLNILKAGRLFKVLKAGHSLVGRTKSATKAITIAKSFAGAVEITSGAGNGLLKLLGLRDTPFGQSVAKYLFFLEIISLSGEISVALRTSLSKAAKEVIEHPELPKIKKQAEEIIKKADNTGAGKKSKEVLEAEEVLEAVRHLDEVVNSIPIFKKILFKEFIKTWGKKNIREVPLERIIINLKGFTPQGNRVASMIESGKIEINILDDIEFDNMLRNSGHGEDKIKGTAAAAQGFEIYFRSSAGLERFMGEIIHEGTHAYDIARIEELLNLGKTKSEIKSIMGDMESFEKRAYFHERAYQEAAGFNEVDFETIDKMLEHIEVGYEGMEVPYEQIFEYLQY